MFQTSTVFLIFLCYMGLLFGIAQLVERRQDLSDYLSQRPWVYALSITVYCTSWTFYGSVGIASSSGLAFLPTYLGPALAIGCWWLLLRKMVRIKERRNITSIADFISARYDRSQAVAMIVTLIALLGTVPYIALQLKAVVSSFGIITGRDAGDLDWEGMGSWVTLMLILFTVAFGARRLDPTERHQGMMAALAVECAVKLVAFLAVGIFVVFGLFDGVGDLFSRLPAEQLDQLTRIGDGSDAAYTRWMTVLFVSAAGILLLPRQFHTAVVENSDERHIRTAIWLVPLYMLLISLFVVPLAAAGRVSGLPLEAADSFVLLLPVMADQSALTALVFLGGLAAASGMIIICAVTLSTMATNHLLVPFINHYPRLFFVRRLLLPARWMVIALILLVSQLFAMELTAGQQLANIGILGFCAALQFVPAVMGGLFWVRGNRIGALWGLGVGFAVWFYTLMVPLLVESALLPASLISDGPLGLGFLRPEALLGLDRFDSVTHACFWSLLLNGAAYLLGSLFTEQRESELELASSYVHALQLAPAGSSGDEGGAHIELEPKAAEARALLEHYFSEKIARSKIRQITEGLGVIEKDHITGGELLRFHRELERVLAGTIGSAAAHRSMKQHLSYSDEENQQVSQVYASILAQLRLTPDELMERISYFEEREKVQRQHALELEAQVREREREIRARRQAERERALALDAQTLVNGLLQLALQPLSLRETLRRALGLVTSAQWLPTEAKGGVFLADEQSCQLTLFVHEGLDPELQQLCAKVAYGHCICGRVASQRQVVFCSDIDERHETRPAGMEPHGHYAVPIESGDKLLGVLVLYLKAGHQQNAQETAFLETVAHTMGALIQRARTAQALAASQSRLRAIMDNSPIAITLKDVDGQYLMANNRFLQIVGAEGVEGQTDALLFGEVAAGQLRDNDRQVIDSACSREFEELIPHADGVHTFLSVKFPLFGEHDEVVAVGTLATDISARIQMEQELQMAYESLEQRVEERTAALSNTLVQMEREIDERISIQQALEHEKSEQQGLIKKLEEAQNQLLQSEKMAAIGQLAAGVAHEINNPVGYINSNLGTLVQYIADINRVIAAYAAGEAALPAESDARREIAAIKQETDFDFISEDIDNLLRECREGVERVRKIVQDLKEFSHSDSGEWQYADLHHCLDSTLNVVWNELKYKAEVVKEYADLPPVNCLASQINQVVMNLLVNAAHAIKERGHIWIRTGQQGDEVWAEIEDDGSGMTREQQKRVFEPFFTTKPVGKGTGLGLSLSYGIIEKHKGRIELSSEPGKGSRFRIWLPIAGPDDDTP
ncbi:ATP-binding protein [Motiliproteus sediminis]|uniref:ATP-binding protein n=1 Tax=Motiliproteus sediminis TaxID=1468178 RepID=UPI001AF011D2|nr:ATP-binding protein [Motiliproteus sediminis]